MAAVDNQIGFQFGYSVGLSADGHTAVIGAPSAKSSGLKTGAAYAYTWTGGDWSLQGKLIPTDAGSGSEAGTGVAISGDGHTVLVGAPSQGDSIYYSGKAYMFTDGSSSNKLFLPLIKR